jgi:hypothetical protein
MEIKAPKSVKDLRIKHVKALLSDDLLHTDTLEGKLTFISIICSVDRKKLYTVDIQDVNKIFNHCADLFNGINLNDTPPNEITIKGIKYKLVDPYRVSTGWHADWSKCDINKDPVKIACMCYIPIGSNYSELDETGNLKDRISDRYEDFKDEFPLVTFLQVSSFFLRNYAKSINRLTVQVQTKMKVQRLLTFMFGRRFSTNSQNTTNAIGKL